MVFSGYVSEFGALSLAVATLTVSCLLPRRAALVVVLVWVGVSRLVARGARNHARPVNETSSEEEKRHARFVMSRTMETEARPVAVVTGTNSGIGYHTAVELAAEGYVVVVTCRSAELTRRTAGVIRDAAEKRRRGVPSRYAHTPVPVLVDGEMPIECDDFASIRRFVAWFTSQYGTRNVQLLVNNAGGLQTGLVFSRFQPELEFHYAANFLGPLLLTELLLPVLEQHGGRVVYVSSGIHCAPQMRFETTLRARLRRGPGPRESCCGLVGARLCDALQALNAGAGKAHGALADTTMMGAPTRYGMSKLLNLYHAHHIARRYRNVPDESRRVYACSLHPGCVLTNFSRFMVKSAVLRVLYNTVSLLFFKSCEEGAQTTLHCAMCPRSELELVVPPKETPSDHGDVVEKSDVEDEAVSSYFAECANKTHSLLLAYGWDVREAESAIAMAKRLVQLDKKQE